MIVGNTCLEWDCMISFRFAWCCPRDWNRIERSLLSVAGCAFWTAVYPWAYCSFLFQGIGGAVQSTLTNITVFCPICKSISLSYPKSAFCSFSLRSNTNWLLFENQQLELFELSFDPAFCWFRSLYLQLRLRIVRTYTWGHRNELVPHTVRVCCGGWGTAEC